MRDQVALLMRQDGLRGAKRRGEPWRSTIPDPGTQRLADLVKPDFTASAPDGLWVCDFTYLRCWETRVWARPFAVAPPRTLEVAPLHVGCCWC